MSTLRGRLALFVVAGTALPLLAGALVLDLAVTRWLRSEFDRALEAKARALVTLTKQEAGVVELDFADEFMPQYSARTLPEYFEIWLDDGVVLERSHTLGESGALPRDPGRSIDGVASPPRFADLVLPDGRPGRSVQLDFVPQIEDADESDETPDPRAETAGAPGLHTAALVVARGRETLDGQLETLHAALGLFVAVALFAMTLLIRPALRLGLRPLDALLDQVGRLDASRLDARIAVPDLPAELAPLAARLDELLERLAAAFQRERRFSSNLAHELRTPIAELRALAEVGESMPEKREVVAGFFRDVRDVAAQMERIVVHLLALARYESGVERAHRTRVDVAAAVDRAWAQQQRQAAQRGIELQRDLAGDLWIETDEEKLVLVLANLFANAIAYSPAGASVGCRSSARAPAALEVAISNPTTDLRPDDLAHVFEPFWRKDESRSGGRSLGLGLPLVKVCAEHLGIDVAVALDPPGVFRVTLLLPR